MALAGLGQALGIIGQGFQQKAQLDWQEQRQANLERIRAEERGQDRADRTAERGEARADREKEFSANKKLQEDQMTATTDYHNKSLTLQEENMRADNKSRSAQLGIAQAGLNLQQDNSEYSRVADAYSGAMAGVAGISSRIAEVEKMQPKVNAEGVTEDLKAFNDRKIQLLADLEDKLEVERASAKTQVDQIHTQFPQYKKYFVQEKPKDPVMQDSTPTLLRRAATAKPF